MVEVTSKLKSKMDAYYKRFGDVVPLEMIPSTETTEGLIQKIAKSLETGEDISKEYDWKFDGTELY